MKNWYDVAIPHEDIRKGDFDEAVFAADLGDVAAQRAALDYNDPYTFFKKTYLTTGLANLLQQVHRKLTTGQGPSIVELQTPFGGGKTHALVLVYHYLTNGKRVQELLPQGVQPIDVVTAAIVGTQFNASEGIRAANEPTRHTLWGELAYQLGKSHGGPAAARDAYSHIAGNDRDGVAPGKADLRRLLEAHQPFILLFDEILAYVVAARGVPVGDTTLAAQTLSFFQQLTEAVAAIPQGMMLVTLPKSELEDFGDITEHNLAQLEKIFGRLETIVTPVQGEEVYSIIRRRLFEPVKDEADVRAAVDAYIQKYQSHRDEFPAKARAAEYRHRMELAYPFHPDLIDILYEKWSTFATFQRTRGVLRLLANVVEDLWEREQPISLILPGDVNLDKPEIRREFLKHIGVEYEGVVGSDVAGVEAKAQLLDRDNRGKGWKHLSQRISTAIFLHSFAADIAAGTGDKGATLPYVKLAVVRPETVTPLVTEVLQKLANELWYLNSRGERFYFSNVPNLNRMIIDKKGLVAANSVREELERLIRRELGSRFRNYLWPSASDALPDNRQLKLAVLDPTDTPSLETLAGWVDRRGEGFRVYKNTLFFALPDAGRYARFADEIREVLALREIQEEIATDQRLGMEEKKKEVDRRIRDLTEEFPLRVRELYRTAAVPAAGGLLETIDLGQPAVGRENLDTWYWNELTGDTQKRIMTRPPSTNLLRAKFLSNQEQVSLAVLLEQFYKDPGIQVPAAEDVLSQAIADAVRNGALGLGMIDDGALQPESVRLNIPLDPGDIHFTEDRYLLTKERAEELLAQIQPPESPPSDPQPQPAEPQPGAPGQPAWQPPTTPTTDPTDTPDTVKQFTIRATGIPTGRIADLNRGVLQPLVREIGEFTFTIEIDVKSGDGIPRKVIEQQVIETLRQLGAKFQTKENVE